MTACPSPESLDPSDFHRWSDLLFASALPMRAKLAAHVTIRHMNRKTGRCNPGIDAIRRAMGIKSEKTARVGLAEAEAAGFLLRTPRPGRTATYAMALPADLRTPVCPNQGSDAPAPPDPGTPVPDTPVQANRTPRYARTDEPKERTEEKNRTPPPRLGAFKRAAATAPKVTPPPADRPGQHWLPVGEQTVWRQVRSVLWERRAPIPRAAPSPRGQGAWVAADVFEEATRRAMSPARAA